MKLSQNALDMVKWGRDSAPDMDVLVRSCAGYAATPGWGVIRQHIQQWLGGFDHVRSVEMGSGLGKVSLLFALLGARVTLLDYSEKQLCAAREIHRKIGANAEFIQGDILRMPSDMSGRYDVAMSFGTAEHFFDDERQLVFDGHASAVRPGGLVIIWVPNRLGVLFHIGRATRRLLKRQVGAIDERSFSRAELRRRAEDAGLTDVFIRGAERLLCDFNNFIFKLPGLNNGAPPLDYDPSDPLSVRHYLEACMQIPCAKVAFFNDYFSYPLLLIARKRDQKT